MTDLEKWSEMLDKCAAWLHHPTHPPLSTSTRHLINAIDTHTYTILTHIHTACMHASTLKHMTHMLQPIIKTEYVMDMWWKRRQKSAREEEKKKEDVEVIGFLGCTYWSHRRITSSFSSLLLLSPSLPNRHVALPHTNGLSQRRAAYEIQVCHSAAPNSVR